MIEQTLMGRRSHEAGAGLADGELLRRFVEGRQETAFAELVARHGRHVWSVCRHILRHEQDAEDAFQATFLLLARKASAIRKQDSVGSWLHGVACRVALKARGRAAAQAARTPPSTPNAAPEPSAEAALREVLALLDEEVARLPEKLRAPFVLCCLQGKSKPEAARELGWPEGSVSGRLAQARTTLRERLARRGVTFSAALTATALFGGPSAAAPPQATLNRASIGSGSGMGGVSASAHALAQAAGREMPWLALARWLLPAALGLALVCAAGVALLPDPAASSEAAEMARPEEPPSAPPDQPPPTTPAKLDAQGDPLPPAALARLGSVRLRHGEMVQGVVFSNDGKLVASASMDGTVRLWNATTGEERARLKSHTGGARSLALSPDGKLLASGGQDGLISLWELDAALRPGPVKPRQLQGHTENVLALAFAPDGKTLASGGWDKTIRIWDLGTQKELCCFGEEKGRVRGLAFAPDGKTLASASNQGNFPLKGSLELWDLTGRHLQTIGTFTHDLHDVAFLPDGDTLVSAGDDGVALWERATGTALHKLRAPFGTARCRLSPDGKTLAVGVTGEISLWTVPTGRLLRRIPCPTSYVYGLAFSPSGQTLATAGTRVVGLWDTATGKALHPTEGHPGEVKALEFAPDNQTLLTGGLGDDILEWDLKTGKERRRITGAKPWNNVIVSSPDRSMLAVVGPNTCPQLIDLATGKVKAQFTGHLPKGSVGSAPVALAFAAEGKELLSASTADKTTRVWDIANRKERTSWNESAFSLVVSPDGRLVASAAPNLIAVRQLPDGDVKWKADLAGGYNRRIAFSPDGRMLAATRDSMVVLWNATTGKELRRFTPHTTTVISMVFSPDSRMLVTLSEKDGRARFWELLTGQERLSVGVPDVPMRGVAFSADGRLLATGFEDTTSIVWELERLVLTTPAGRNPGARELDAFWLELGDNDARAAYAALWKLRAAPHQTVPLVRGRVQKIDEKRLARLLTDLDHDDFAVREQASVELASYGRLVEAALRKGREETKSAEVRLRIDALLEKLPTNEGRATMGRRSLRAVELLEMIGDDEARKLLDELSGGDPESTLTQEAKSSRERLRKQE
jgi:RNA polymerase sigma factor (sigma-70 family)